MDVLGGEGGMGREPGGGTAYWGKGGKGEGGPRTYILLRRGMMICTATVVARIYIRTYMHGTMLRQTRVRAKLQTCDKV